LGYFRGPTETGYYKLAKNFAGGLSHLTRPLQSVAYPKLARLWNAGLLEDFRKALYNFVVILGIPLILVLILCVLTIPSLIFYMLDTPYLMASSAAQLLLIVTGVRLIGFWIRPLYLVMGRIRLLTTFALVGAIVTIPVYVSSIWLCGFQGLAISRVGLAIVTDIIAGVVGILLTIENDHGTWKSDGKTIIRKDRNLL
jgi:O-antigen/teichoic acid export membrane protein